MNLKGSSLIFSLIVLSFLLVSALSVATISVTARRSSLSSKNSNISFQVADSAAELVLKQIYQVNDKGTPIDHIKDIIGEPDGTCPGFEIDGTTDVGEYTAVFYENTGTVASPIFSPINCGEPTWRAKVVKIKFQGTYRETIRAIEVSVAPKNDAVAWWEFNVGAGTVAIDSTLNGNDGTLSNTSMWVTPLGRTSPALSFNGTNQYVSTDVAKESNFDFNRSDTFSGCAWVNTTTNSSVSQTVISKLDNSSPNSGWEFNLYNPATSKSDRLQFYLINTYPTNSINVVATSVISPNTWYHACFTYDGSSNANGVKFYLNGNLESTSSTVSDTLSSSILNNKPLQLGARDGTNWPFSGMIDDVRVYKRVLSLSEIDTIYNTP